jgi:ATP-dependent RNA helicase RhlE
MKFEDLGLAEPLVRGVRAQGYRTATPVQVEAIPDILQGRDLMGCAQTGTGKTAAFALPTLQRLACRPGGRSAAHSRNRRAGDRPIRSLIVAPTRELAVQIGVSVETYGKYGGLRQTVVFGGVSQNPQVRALQAGVDILIATPGRLLDLMSQGHVDLGRVEILILDEADQLLDMGFLPDLRRIVAATPTQRQTLMFSATMPEEIRRLASRWLRQPTYVQVTPNSSPVDSVKQSVYFVESRHKPQLLTHYLQSTACKRTLVFARTKHGVDKIVRQLVRAGICAAAIHGNKSQNTRTRTLEQFKSQEPPVLVATDIAARGLDVEAVSHVINYELPEIPEIYVHRIGRTGRAGANGVATSFCGGDERRRLKRIERLTRRSILVEQDQPKYAPPRQSSSSSSGAVSRPRRAAGKSRPGNKGRAAPSHDTAQKTEAQPNSPKGRYSKRRRKHIRP